MVHDIRTFIQNANAAKTNAPGTCLKTVRTWAGIPSRYPDAATAWRNTNDRHPGDRSFPEGCFVYWTGGSHGYGHITAGLTKNRIRSTDCTTSGHVSTVELGWIEQHWGLTYAGWAWDCNEVTMPHPKDPGPEPAPPKPEEDMPKFSRTRLTKPVSLTANTWTTLVWDTVSSGDAGTKDKGYVLIDNSAFTATLQVQVTATGTGSIRTRLVEKNKDDKGDWQNTEVYMGSEHQNTGGDTYLTDTRTQNVKAATRLSAQVSLPSDGQVQSAELNVLYF